MPPSGFFETPFVTNQITHWHSTTSVPPFLNPALIAKRSQLTSNPLVCARYVRKLIETLHWPVGRFMTTTESLSISSGRFAKPRLFRGLQRSRRGTLQEGSLQRSCRSFQSVNQT